MRLQNIDAHIREMIHVLDLDDKHSEYTSRCTLEDLACLATKEAQELEHAMREGLMDSIFDELSDTFGRLLAILIRLENRGYDLEEILGERFYNKYRTRKPHIFENRTVPIDIEQATWDFAKKAQP